MARHGPQGHLEPPPALKKHFLISLSSVCGVNYSPHVKTANVRGWREVERQRGRERETGRETERDGKGVNERNMDISYGIQC